MKTVPNSYRKIGIERDFEFYKGVSGYNPETGEAVFYNNPYIDWCIMEVDLVCGHKGVFKTSGIGADNVFCEICKA